MKNPQYRNKTTYQMATLVIDEWQTSYKLRRPANSIAGLHFNITRKLLIF
jgi:hypothetical protein